MEKTTIALLLLSVTIFFSCRKEAKEHLLGIDVQAEFVQDSVQVFIDDELLISKRLETNPLLGVCTNGTVRATKTAGNHRVKVIVNNTFTKIDDFSLHKDAYIGVNFDRATNNIFFYYADTPFIYE